MNIVDTFKVWLLSYGAEWVLWFLIGLSLVVLVVGLERWVYFWHRTGNTQRLAVILEQHLRDTAYSKPAPWPKGKRSVAVGIIEAGLAMADRGEQAATQAMQSRIVLERERLEKRLIVIGTIGNNAPFVGLLGTVIGVVHAFEALGHAATATQQQSATVMAAIAEALVATAVGLLVAIPAVAIYNFFQRWMGSLIASTEVLTRLLLAHIALRDGTAPSAPDGGQSTTTPERKPPHHLRATVDLVEVAS